MNLKELRVLWLSDNPCADHPNYKQFVARLLPNLQKLDNDDVATILMDAAIPGLAGNASVPTPASAPASPYGTPGDRVHSPGSVTVASPSDNGTGATPGSVGRPQNGGGNRSSKNILYAVMALLGELDDDDLVYVRREIEQRLGGR